MRPRRARGDHDPVEVVLGDALLDGLQAVGGAGVDYVLGVFNIGQPGGMLRHALHIHYAGYVNAAVADEDAYAGSVAGDVYLLDGVFLRGDVLAFKLEILSGPGHGPRCGDYRFRDVLRAVRGSAYENPLACRLDRPEGIGAAETVFIELDIQLI